LVEYTNSAHGKAVRQQYSLDNPDVINRSRSNYQKTEKFKRSNKKKVAKRYKKMRSDDALWLKEKVRTKVGRMLRKAQKGLHSSSKTVSKITEFTNTQDLVAHFESKFQEGMTRLNHGRGNDKWHVGHEIPQAYFNPNSISDVKRCWMKANLFPQWQHDNLTQNVKLPSIERLNQLHAMGCLPEVFGGVVPSTEEMKMWESRAVYGKVFG